MQRGLDVLDRLRGLSSRVVLALLILVGFSTTAQAQSDELRDPERRRIQAMLNGVVREVRGNYYDPAFAGLDVDALAETARQRIDAANSIGQAWSAIAQFTMEFDDSHTFFLPPFQTVEVDYGWETGIVGGEGMVLRVKPESDAAKQGVRRGDVVKAINGLPISRENLWKIEYLFNVLRPQPGLRVELLTPQGEARELNLAAKVKARDKVVVLQGQGAGYGWARLQDDYDEYRHEQRLRIFQAGDGVLVAKLREFSLAEDEPQKILSAARGRDTLILDLRGNSGGTVNSLKQLVSGLFAADVNIATIKERKGDEPLWAKGKGQGAFPGKVMLLIDGQSASASEVLARTLQLGGRGKVIGDRSSGAVMLGRHHSVSVNRGDYVIAGGVNVTIGDLVMPDGGRLEKIGVVPDVLVVPMQADLAADRDPVLAKALELAGRPVTAAAAGAMLSSKSKERD